MTNHNPKVSIIIPVYNGSNYLKEAIDSAIAQTYKNIEIIVVNDGSNDDGATEEIAKSYGNKIRYFKKENGGVATALNLGIKKMTGEYFSWLSHDDVYYPEKVEKQISVTKDCKVATIIYSDVEYIDNQSRKISKTSYGTKCDKKQLSSGLFLVTNGMANGCSLLINKSLFKTYGLFNEELKTSNDYDMWFRMLRTSPVKFIPETLIKYRLHENQGTRTDVSYEEESDDLWLKIIKNISFTEVNKFSDSIFTFYFDLSKRMRLAGLSKAFEAANTIARDIYKKEEPCLVSIIMPCYNSEIFLEEAINSILDQTLSNLELIVVDDSSTDQTADIIKKMQKDDFRISLFKNKYLKGIAGAMNTGIDASVGIYIARMDSDDISLPDRLYKQYSFLEKNKNYGLCSANISLFGDVERDEVFKYRNAPIEWLFLWENPIANAPTMYRASIIRDNSLKFNNLKSAEDYDFLINFLQFTKPATLQEVLYRYRVRSDSVFHSNIDETLGNSVKICRRFAKTIVGREPYKYHEYLTVFGDYRAEDIDIIELAIWVDELLKDGLKKWDWSEDEYEAALMDANERVRGLLKRGTVDFKELEKLEKDLTSKIETLSLENIQLSRNTLKNRVARASNAICNFAKRVVNKLILKLR